VGEELGKRKRKSTGPAIEKAVLAASEIRLTEGKRKGETMTHVGIVERTKIREGNQLKKGGKGIGRNGCSIKGECSSEVVLPAKEALQPS